MRPSAGNAWTDAAIDNGGAVDFWYGHGIVSADLQQGIHRYCQMDAVGPLKTHPTTTAECALNLGGYHLLQAHNFANITGYQQHADCLRGVTL